MCIAPFSISSHLPILMLHSPLLNNYTEVNNKPSNNLDSFSDRLSTMRIRRQSTDVCFWVFAILPHLSLPLPSFSFSPFSFSPFSFSPFSFSPFSFSPFSPFSSFLPFLPFSGFLTSKGLLCISRRGSSDGRWSQIEQG
jgi:hypothetical protein